MKRFIHQNSSVTSGYSFVKTRKKKTQKILCTHVFYHYIAYICYCTLLLYSEKDQPATKSLFRRWMIMNLCYQKTQQGDLCVHHGGREDRAQRVWKKSSAVSWGEWEMKKAKVNRNRPLVNLHQCLFSSAIKWTEQSKKSADFNTSI